MNNGKCNIYKMKAKKPLNRIDEQSKFLTEHFENEIKRIIGDYLIKMHDIDRTYAAASVSVALGSAVAHAFRLFSQDQKTWDECLKQHINDVKGHKELIIFDGQTYFDDFSKIE